MYVGIFRLYYLLNAGLDVGIGGGSPPRPSVHRRLGPGGPAVALFVVVLLVPTHSSGIGSRPATAVRTG